MDILATTSSVETHLVLETSRSSLKDLLRLTLLDLLLKRVLELRIVDIQHHPNDPVIKDYYVIAGANFNGYRYKAHERVLLQTFIRNSSSKLLLRHLINKGLKTAKDEKTFIFRYIRKSPLLRKKFKGSILYSLFGVTRLNEEGKELQEHLFTEIRGLEVELPKLLLQDPQKALETLLAIKGNLFLLRNVKTNILDKINPAFFKEIKQTTHEKIDFGEQTYFWDLLTIYSRFTHDFDRAFDSVEQAIVREDTSFGYGASGFLEVLVSGIWG